MSSRFKQTSFKKDGYKRIFCSNCGAFLTELYLGEKKSRVPRCTDCHSYNVIKPPVKATYQGVSGYWVEGNDSCFTAVAE